MSTSHCILFCPCTIPAPNKQTNLGTPPATASSQPSASKASIDPDMAHGPPHPCYHAQWEPPRHPCDCHATAMPMCTTPRGATQSTIGGGVAACCPLLCGRGVVLPVSLGGWVRGTYMRFLRDFRIGMGLPFWNGVGWGGRWLLHRCGRVLAGLFLLLVLLGMEVGGRYQGVCCCWCVRFGDSWLGGQRTATTTLS